MYQTGTLILRFASREDAKAAFPLVKSLTAHADDWGQRLMVSGKDITAGEDGFIAAETYRDLVLSVCQQVAEGQDIPFICYAEHLSDDGEIHETVSWKNGLFRYHKKEEVYDSGQISETCCTGAKKNDRLVLEDTAEPEGESEEDRCSDCGEYYSRSAAAPVSRCPFCGELAEHETVGSDEPIPVAEPGWKTYEYEIPLGIALPEIPVSEGMDWLSDCNVNDTFELDPACFRSKNQYDAALMLCEVCGGWYRFDSEEERQERAEVLRRVLASNPGEPMWYYDVWGSSFDWVAALREANPRYPGHFSDIDTLWELFSRLQQRSCLEKAECFAWFVDFFGDALRFDKRNQLADGYAQSYDGHMETVLYLFPEQIAMLTDGPAVVSTNACRYLARTAAGLIRMGHRADGMELYQKLFEKVWTEKSSADEKKAVIDEFMERLAAGYENEPYLDEELRAMLARQSEQYSDGKWTTKVRLMLEQNRISK